MEIKTEKIFFENDDILITNARAVFGDLTFSIANIASVLIKEVETNWIYGGAVMLTGVLIGLCTLHGWGMLFVSLFSIALGFFIGDRLPHRFILTVYSSSGEQNVVSAESAETIEDIAKAINIAIIERS